MNIQQMTKKIANAFDSFIIETGGNTDPRAASNMDRIALIKFWETISSLDKDEYDFVTINRCMRDIINRKFTKRDFRCDKKFSVYDHLGNSVRE